MGRELLSPLTPVMLEIRDDDSVDRYPTMIFDADEAEGVLIGAPMRAGYEVGLKMGSIVTVQIAKPDGMRRFTSEVVGRSDVGGPRVRLAWPDRIEHVQRREAFRVETAVEVTVEPTDDATFEPLTGLTLDLSEGGTKLALPEKLEADTVVDLRLDLRDHGECRCVGRVLRSGRIEDSPPQRYWTAIQFVELSSLARRDLTRFIFELQRELLRRGFRA